MRSQSATPKGSGGRRYLPYAFTEQSIAMLSVILNSDIAVDVSIQIIDTFVEMRRFVTNNAGLFERISNVELKQLEYQKRSDEKFNEIFEYIGEHTKITQKVFFDGQIYDAFSLIIDIIKQAASDIILVDGYVNVSTLNILAKKKRGVSVEIYTHSNTKLTVEDIATFNKQYPLLTVCHTKAFHDRFIILDKQIVYHIGASIKDAGMKCFGLSLIEDPDVLSSLLKKL